MNTTCTVVAVRAFEWQGRSITPGESLRLTPIEAVALAHKHLITLTRRKAARMVPPDPVRETPSPSRRRRYKRTDLQPDETVVLQADEPESPDA